MSGDVRRFHEIDRSQVALVGGKGAHLAELSRIEGVRVPAGFCVTTDAFRRIVTPALTELLDRLAAQDGGDRDAIRALSAALRRAVEAIVVPDDLAAEIAGALSELTELTGLTGLGDDDAFAVRSSATAEDLPTASFAGQQDTYLNVVGPAAVAHRISRCWGSLFTERAVSYRLRNGFDQRSVQMAVVVQQMVIPEAAGVLFTADPVTSDRHVALVEATFGLGEALVSGRVDPDAYRVRDGEVVERTIATKARAVRARPGGGTEEVAIEPARRRQPTLTDTQVVRLADLGRRIEAHFGSPQDIEWCLVGDDFAVVQSRAITTLFPVPLAADGANHVYVSVGHQQMMTDPMKPLGISLFQLTALPPMHEAGGRLFVDVTRALAAPTSRAGVLDALGRSDPLIRDALETVVERDGFLPPAPAGGAGGPPAPPAAAPEPIDTDPAVVAELMASTEASVAALARDIRGLAGPDLIEFILADIPELKRILFDPRSHQVFMGAMEASWWLNERLETWLGQKNVADTLTRSVPDNVTSEMGLALLDVADVIRPHPDVVALLQQVDDDGFLDELVELEGGTEARHAIIDFLDRYGRRCVGEIDITRPRWRERPSTLVPVILANVRNFEPGAGARRFEQGRREAASKEHEVLTRLRALADEEKLDREQVDETKQMIDRVRTFIGYREYPKFGMVSRYAVYKRALLEEAARLVQAGVLGQDDDLFYLTLPELLEVTRTQEADAALIDRRRQAFRSYASLTPPRVLTSDGEALAGAYRRDDAPVGALIGLPVSAGIVEGRARVILDMEEADLDVGDILVTAYTDPSWSPLFVAIAGLVTEVGGLMTHGAVIAREYGLPAVVGVEHATRLISDGQRIRVHGTDGYVEIVRSSP